VNSERGSEDFIDLGFDKMVFPKPKPVGTIIRTLKLATEKDSFVLDFFSGSATTAHAVMQLNAEDGGKRKFIMVQLPEVCAPDSEAAKAGYKNICEIGKERIRRAGEKIESGVLSVESGVKDKTTSHSTLQTSHLDTGFRVLKLDDTNMKDVHYAATEYTQDLIALMESNIKDDRTDMDLLFSCLLDWGLPLSMPHTCEWLVDTDDGLVISENCPLKTENSYAVHTYNNGDLVACFADKISDIVVRAIAKRQPLRAVFRDSSFTGSPEKINVFEIFKLLAPNTKVKVV
jgi:adenine-specific DNA-methyltransferase